MSLKKQVAHGVKWVSISLVGTRVFSFITTIILARLLVPEMFGLVSMSNVAIGTIGIIRELGFGAAYIQKQYGNDKQERLAANTAFFIGCTLNIFLFTVCFLLTPIIAEFFRSRELENILRVMVFSFLIELLITMPRLTLQKNLEFRKISICQIVRGLSASVTAVTLALLGFGVWSLVISHLFSKAVFGSMLLIMSSWKLRFEFSTKILKEMIAYGKYIWGYAIITALGKALDKAIIGRYFGAESLGYYSIAFKLCDLPNSLISRLLSRITFPVFSKIQSDKLRLKNALIQTLSNVSIIVIPMSLGLVAVSNYLIFSLFGQKWSPSIPIVNILAFHGLFLSIASVTGPVFKAIGKQKVIFYTSILHQIILALMLYLLRDYGVEGVAYSVLMPMIVSSIIAFVFIKKYLELSYFQLLRPIISSGCPAVLMFIVVKVILTISPDFIQLTPLQYLLGSIFISFLTYLYFSSVLNRYQFNKFRSNLIEIIRSKEHLTNNSN